MQTRPDPAMRAATIDAAELLQRGADDAARTDDIRRALTDPGYLLIDGLFDDTAEDLALLQQMQAFFALADDDARKQAVCVSGKSEKHGWMPLYGEPAYQPGTVARVESFDCGRPGGAPLADQWPDIAGFRDATVAVWQRFSELGFALLEEIAATAGLPRAWFCERCDSQDLSTMRLLHYPGEPGATATSEVGIAAHSDFECITLLYQTAEGLELRHPNGSWHDAPGNDRRVVVLFGDMLETWTNGTVRATAHRVRMTARPRNSIVLFFAVNDGVEVAPLESFTGTRGQDRYPPVTQRRHSQRMLSRAEHNRDEAQSP